MHCPQCSNIVRGSGRFCVICGYDLASSSVLSGTGLLSSGYVLDRRYRVLEHIATGGMAHVYRVEDHRLKNIYALKEMMDNFRLEEEKRDAVHRFSREAELLARLKHPSIPRIIDHFVENGRYYLVMDFITGENLESALDSYPFGKFPEQTVMPWIRQITDVLEYLHSLNPPVIYRDMKPSNILLGEDGRIYLIDFGIARLFMPQKKGTLIGTPGYAPPEQYKGEADIRSDMYSLAATIHHLITGRDPRTDVPFNFPPVKSLDPDANEFLSAILDKALAYKTEDRYQTIGEFSKALSEIESLNEAQIWNNRGMNLMKTADYIMAEQAFTEAVKADGSNVKAYINRGVSREKQGKGSAALEDYREAEKIEPENQEVLYNLGCSLKKSGEMEQAYSYFERTVRKDPRHIQALNNMGNIFFIWKEWQKAQEMYETALRVDPTFKLASDNLEKVKKKIEYQAQLQQFNQAANFDSDPSRAFYNLGMYFMLWGRLDEAENEFEKSLRFEKGDPDPHEGLGTVLFKKGDWKKAGDKLETALRMDPSRIRLYRMLGVCYHKTGRNREAQVVFEAGMAFIRRTTENWRADNEFIALKAEWENSTGMAFDIARWEKHLIKTENAIPKKLREAFVDFLKNTNLLK
ncbi:MAG: protein kinase [Firmicutes bacterium]|nr:protein kinase [Bacillota bacterium]